MKITKKLYESLKIGTYNIFNCKNLSSWLLDNINLHHLSRLHLLCKDNRKDFKQLWGKPNWHYNVEFYYSVWVREFQGLTFIVLTSKGKGTCIEVVLPSYEINQTNTSRTIINFCQDTYEKLLVIQDCKQ